MILIIDSDASKVIDAVRATGVTITRPMIEYTHYIIKSMKAIGTWDLCNAVYGFVGGTADSHKFNWKNPIDTDGAFRLTFPNGMTHDSFGITGNGSNRYAQTFFKPRTQLGNSSLSVSVYSTKDTAETGTKILIGAINTTDLSIISIGMTFSVEITLSNNAGQDYSNVTKRADNKGYALAKTGVGVNSSTYNNRLSAFTAKFNSSLSSDDFVYILARNQAGSATNASSKSLGFAHLGSGFTDIQAIQQSQIISNAQNILNRA